MNSGYSEVPLASIAHCIEFDSRLWVAAWLKLSHPYGSCAACIGMVWWHKYQCKTHSHASNVMHSRYYFIILFSAITAYYYIIIILCVLHPSVHVGSLRRVIKLATHYRLTGMVSVFVSVCGDWWSIPGENFMVDDVLDDKDVRHDEWCGIIISYYASSYLLWFLSLQLCFGWWQSCTHAHFL
jgi:hypothetical protein